MAIHFHRPLLLGSATVVAGIVTAGLWAWKVLPAQAADGPAKSVVTVVMPTEAGPPLSVKDLSAEEAQAIVAVAAAKAKDMGVKMDIALVDAGGNLKAFLRMDGAWLGSIDIAIKKAKTARFFDMPTGEIGKLSQPGGPLFNIEHSNGGLITFPGGVPLKTADGSVIGAIGVSGSTVENDHIVATAGAAVIK